MRKYIEIDEEVLKSIMEGTYVQGSLHYNKHTSSVSTLTTISVRNA